MDDGFYLFTVSIFNALLESTINSQLHQKDIWMIHYKLAAIADLETLIQFVQEFHQHENLERDETLNRNLLEHFLTDPALGQAWLIQQDDEAIGYFILTLGYSLEYEGRDAFLDELYLRPQYRKQGIGTQTLAFAEEACRALGVHVLHLEVDFDNSNAQHLYHTVGYQKHDRFLMSKYL